MKQQRVFNVSVREDLLPWWDGTVEPLIRKLGMTRTEFIMQAVRREVDARS